MHRYWIPAIIAALTLATTPEAQAHTYRHHFAHHAHYHHHRCHGGDGVVGTIAGGAGGALIGHAMLGGPVGIVAGGVGGALLGRHLDKVHTRHKHRC